VIGPRWHVQWVSAPRGSRSGFEDPVPKSTATRRGRHEARSRSVAESGRKGDPGRIGLHRNRDDAGAILSETVDRLRRRLEAGVFQSSEITWEALTSVYRTVLGTPDQVAERIAFWCEQAQSSRIIVHLHTGDMPHWKAVKNITLFAEEVIPRLRRKMSPNRMRKNSVLVSRL